LGSKCTSKHSSNYKKSSAAKNGRKDEKTTKSTLFESPIFAKDCHGVATAGVASKQRQDNNASNSSAAVEVLRK
jgi:hypothetical protein